ncbi:potassium channel family protein [Fulvivirga ligni]|uniref:potassium channel family protein n=1 Tax=Fulvivirga ligni TaxID=2904246 RepID=UPI001F341620|nr:potassium channel family protein [Fulvivirga ligni]UII20942.1 ion channel [Fulvivirga ligni]
MRKWRYYILAFLAYVGVICLIGVVEQKSPDANIKSISDAFWYAIVTLTTVGYGDFYPVTPVGKVIGLFLIIGSIGVLGYVIGEITSKFNQYMEKKKYGFWGTDFEGHYVIIGWNEFGRQVAEQIFNSGHKIAFVVDSKADVDIIKDIFPSDNCFCMFADFHNMEAYKKVNLNKSNGVFVNFKEDTETLVFVLNLKKAYQQCSIVVTCANPALKDTFMNAGIRYVIAQSEVASRLVASYIFEPSVASYTEDLITTSISDGDSDIQQYRILKSNRFAGGDYLDAFHQLKEEFNAVAIGMVSDNKVIKNPSKGQQIQAGDYLILISDGNSKKKLEAAFGVMEGE